MRLSRDRESRTMKVCCGGTGVKQGFTCCCVYMCHLKEAVNLPSRILMTCVGASHTKLDEGQLKRACLGRLH